jgi:hypothetical protein
MIHRIIPPDFELPHSSKALAIRQSGLALWYICLGTAHPTAGCIGNRMESLFFPHWNSPE